MGWTSPTEPTTRPQAFNKVTELLRQHQTLIWWIAAISAVAFVASLVLVPLLAVRIPSDYFASRKKPRSKLAENHPLLRLMIVVSKNVAGIALLLSGIAMLLLPGQGLLTIAIGLLLMDFPGKHRLERRVAKSRPVRRSINWIRKKRNVPPLQFEVDTPIDNTSAAMTSSRTKTQDEL